MGDGRRTAGSDSAAHPLSELDVIVQQERGGVDGLPDVPGGEVRAGRRKPDYYALQGLRAKGHPDKLPGCTERRSGIR